MQTAQCEHTKHCHLWFYCGFIMSCKNSHLPLCSSSVWVQPHHVDQLRYHVKPQQQAHRGVLKCGQESHNLVGSQVVVVVCRCFIKRCITCWNSQLAEESAGQAFYNSFYLPIFMYIWMMASETSDRNAKREEKHLIHREFFQLLEVVFDLCEQWICRLRDGNTFAV